MTIRTGLAWFQLEAAALHRGGPFAFLLAAAIVAIAVLAAPRSAWAAVVVTDAPAFVVAISAAESVILSCNTGQVRVEVVGESTTDYLTSCGSVSSFTVTAAGNFPNTIDLSAIVAIAFPSVTSVSLTPGPGADSLTGSALTDAVTWNPGDGNDTITAGPAFDILVFNGSAGDETFLVAADGSGFDVQRTIGSVTLDVAEVENLVILAGEGTNTLVVETLVGVTNLAQISFNSGMMPDVADGAAQANAAISLAFNGGAGADQLTGGSGYDVLAGDDGDDLLAGGAGNDVFVWNPGDDSDDIAGGAGSDFLDFNGSAGIENFTIAATGGGFDLFRDAGVVHLETTSIDMLDLEAEAGDDVVMTVPLGGTVQSLNGGAGSATDTLNVDAQGECVTVGAGTIEVAGYGLIQHVEFENVEVVNSCPSEIIFIDSFESVTF